MNLNLKDYIKIDSKRLAGFLVAFALLFVLSAYASFNILVDKFTLEVPEFIGRDMQEVAEILDVMAITVSVTGEEFDREMEAGRVLSQSVESGTIVSGQTEVEVVLSKGSEVRLIPSVIGLAYDEASEMLWEQQLEVEKVIRVHTGRVKDGLVLAQRPVPEEWTGESMTLVVSVGPRDVIYYNPYFLGMDKMDALMLARDLGLSVRVSELDNSNVISYQSPEPGAEIKRGGVLRLRVGG